MICRIVHARPSALRFEFSQPRGSRESQRFPAEGLAVLAIPDLRKVYTSILPARGRLIGRSGLALWDIEFVVGAPGLVGAFRDTGGS